MGGVGQGEESYARAAGMIILGLMPPEGLEEAIDTLKEMYEFYAYPPERVLPVPKIIDVASLVTPTE